MKSHDAIRRMVQASLLTALAVILSIWPKFPLFPAVSWMKFEFSDIPVLLGGFSLGPVFGLAIAVLKALLNAVFTGDWNYIGLIMNIVSTGIPTVAASLLYNQNKTRVRAYISLGVFLLTQIGVMIPMNYFVGSLNFMLFFGVPTYEEARAAMAPLLGWVALFNLIKGAATTVVTAIVYKPLSRTVLSKELLMPKEGKKAPESTNSEESLDNPM
ncbi:MAG: ECF transporter S component [Clostridia bacterium]|jgi:riboflavin transporter FmnP|nr:ECF transporter S component [Clostridia bacterium]